jgi:hypothetical protein
VFVLLASVTMTLLSVAIIVVLVSGIIMMCLFFWPARYGRCACLPLCSA